jgi:hypothetical protein
MKDNPDEVDSGQMKNAGKILRCKILNGYEILCLTVYSVISSVQNNMSRNKFVLLATYVIA